MGNARDSHYRLGVGMEDIRVSKIAEIAVWVRAVVRRLTKVHRGERRPIGLESAIWASIARRKRRRPGI